MWCIAIRHMTVRFPAITLMVSLKMTSITASVLEHRSKLAHEQQRFNSDMVILADVNAQPSHISKPLMQRIEYFSSPAGQRLIPAIYVRRLSHVWNDWSMYATVSYLHLFALWQAMKGWTAC